MAGKLAGNLVSGEFRPRDEYAAQITQTTTFKIIADYGNSEVAEAETQVKIANYGTRTPSAPGGKEPGGLFQTKPTEVDLDGSLDVVFNKLSDRIHDYKVKGITYLDLCVSQVMDYRKLMTALPLLMKLPLQIDQTATITAGDQFVRLEYQGAVRGFQSFQAAINTLLSSADVKADVSLKLVFEFSSPVSPDGTEIATIKQALNRNPVDRLNLTVKVTY
jgi:hypothetical protein